MLWVVEVIKWDLRCALCRKRKLLQFKATCTNVTYKPLKYHPDGSFLLHHTFPNCFQKGRKEEMKDDRLDGSAKEVVGSWGGGGVLFSSFILSFFALPLHPHFYFCQFRNEGKPSTGRRGKCLGVGGACAVRAAGSPPPPAPRARRGGGVAGRRLGHPGKKGWNPAVRGEQRLGCLSPTWGWVPAAPQRAGAGGGPRAREPPNGGSDTLCRTPGAAPAPLNAKGGSAWRSRSAGRRSSADRAAGCAERGSGAPDPYSGRARFGRASTGTGRVLRPPRQGQESGAGCRAGRALTMASPMGRRPGGRARRPEPRPRPHPVPRGRSGGAGAPAPHTLLYKGGCGRDEARELVRPPPASPRLPQAEPGGLLGEMGAAAYSVHSPGRGCDPAPGPEGPPRVCSLLGKGESSQIPAQGDTSESDL